MATYSDVNNTTASVHVPFTPAEFDAAAASLLVDLLSAYDLFFYGEEASSSYTDSSLYILFTDGSELSMSGDFSGTTTITINTMEINTISGLTMALLGNVKVNLNNLAFSGKFTEMEIRNDEVFMSMLGSLSMDNDGNISGSVSAVTYGLPTSNPLVIDALSFAGSLMFDINGNVTGNVNAVDLGQIIATDSSFDNVTWSTTASATGLTQAIESLDVLTSFDSLFGLDLSGNDTVTGTAGDDYIDAGAGKDIVDGLAGNDTLIGSDGHDTLTDKNGHNSFEGGAGNNTITAGKGNDTIKTGNGDNTIKAGEGDNTITTGSGDDLIRAGSGNDKIKAGAGHNDIDAGAGKNNISSGDGNDVITTGDGNDKINAGDGQNIIDAGGGKNIITTGNGADSILSGTGNDEIDAGAGDNAITAGDGKNVIGSAEGNDVISSGSHKDTINAGDGNNFISSGAGNDKVTTGSGNDLINSGAGADILKGGAGSDMFVFDNLATGGYDTIKDFAAVKDLIQLDTSVFNALSGGISANNFAAAASTPTAQDMDDFLLFERDTGALYYDADGNGVGAPVQIALLQGSKLDGFDHNNLLPYTDYSSSGPGSVYTMTSPGDTFYVGSPGDSSYVVSGSVLTMVKLEVVYTFTPEAAVL